MMPHVCLSWHLLLLKWAASVGFRVLQLPYDEDIPWCGALHCFQEGIDASVVSGWKCSPRNMAADD